MRGVAIAGICVGALSAAWIAGSIVAVDTGPVTPPPAARIEQPSRAQLPPPPIALRLRLSRHVVAADRCVRGTVVAPGAARAVASIHGGPGAAVHVEVRDGEGATRLCGPWRTGRRLHLRASAAHAAASRAVPLRIVAPRWTRRLDRRLGHLSVSMSVRVGRRLVFSHLGGVPRVPASNEKLLLSMALLDRMGASASIPTNVESRSLVRGEVRGDLWLVGHGDPEVDEATLQRLARRVRSRGVSAVRGSVVGDTSTFRRERWAPGWRAIALDFIPVPTALTFEGNVDARGFVQDPELRAASAFTDDLRALGVEVGGRPRAGPVAPDARVRATVRSARIADILRRQNVTSSNLDAEVLDKLLGARAVGPPGTIAKGAAAIRAWAADHGVDAVVRDAAGLSYANRITTDDMVSLLAVASRSPWGVTLRSTLPAAGEGTLAGRLAGVDVRAKTGTLLGGISALSGWVRLEAGRRWAAFSILSSGLSKAGAVALEDALVRIVAGATCGAQC